MRGVVCVLAAGEGTRLGDDTPKAFVDLDGVPILRRAADAACAAELVDSIVVAVPPGCEERAADALDGIAKPGCILPGGPSRQASADRSLDDVGDAHAVLIHDAARPLCSSYLFDEVLRALDDAEAVCPVVPLKDTIKEVTGEVIVGTLDRSVLAAAQTPQGFHTELYRRAHAEARRTGFVGTDDASLVERLGVKVRTILGDPGNVKITTRGDLATAAFLLAR